MLDTLDWKTVHERLGQVLPHSLDKSTWQELQHYSLTLVADELLWRVEAFAPQVPAQGTIFFRSIARTDSLPHRPVIAPDPVSKPCTLCDDQPGNGIGKRCTLCVAAIRLVLGFPLVLDEDHKTVAPEQHTEKVVSNLFGQ